MRLSKGATTGQTVTVYVAAPYRVDTTKLPDPAIAPKLLYAGRTEGESYPQLVAPTSFLTAYTGFVLRAGPDHRRLRLRHAATDAEYQRVTYVTRNDGLLSTIGVLSGCSC